jgi:hypothetical protein
MDLDRRRYRSAGFSSQRDLEHPARVAVLRAAAQHP